MVGSCSHPRTFRNEITGDEDSRESNRIQASFACVCETDCRGWFPGQGRRTCQRVVWATLLVCSRGTPYDRVEFYHLRRRPGRDDSWTPALLGFHKRELLREVLNIFGTHEVLTDMSFYPSETFPSTAKSKTLTKMALDWQDMLKKAAIDE